VPPPSRSSAELPSSHAALVCVALQGLVISPEHGQLNGEGLEGFYRAGRRVLSRCQVRVAGREPLAVQARMPSADRALFVGTLRVSPHSGPDTDAVVEHSAPLGEIVLTGLRINGAPFSVRVSRLGLAMVEEAADGLQLGV
jgi:hypothetical protein